MPASQTIIPRSRVIPGAKDDDFHVVDNRTHYPRVVQTATVTLTAADVQGLDATTVEILEAPESGRAYAVLGVHASKAAGAYGGGAAVPVEYADNDGTNIASIPLAHFTAGGTDARWATRVALAGLPAAQVVPAAGIRVGTVGTAFTGAGGDVTITVRYVEVATS